MPLMPKRVKYRKQQRGSRKGMATRGQELAFGEYGLQALKRAWITAIQIEACRVAISRAMKRATGTGVKNFAAEPVPLIGKVPTASALLFDLGVYLLVVGATVLVLIALAHQSLRSSRYRSDETAAPEEDG